MMFADVEYEQLTNQILLGMNRRVRFPLPAPLFLRGYRGSPRLRFLPGFVWAFCAIGPGGVPFEDGGPEKKAARYFHVSFPAYPTCT